jgi:SAM-dependent methyltransferase
MTVDRSCACCTSSDTRPYLPGLVQCRQCTHVWAPLDFAPEEQISLYGETYFKGAEYADYEAEASALRRNFRGRVRELADLLPKGAKLFEIGAAYGFFLQEARSMFDVAGCDISEHAAEYAREKFGLDVQAGDYLAMNMPAPLDAVCAWDVIEHLPHPGLFLEKAAGDLKPGGILALTTGDIGSIAARIRGPRWRLIHPPTHIHYFTRKSIAALLGRLGFSDPRIRYHPFWRSADAVGRSILPPALYTRLQAKKLLTFNFPINLFDIMTVYAHKLK